MKDIYDIDTSQLMTYKSELCIINKRHRLYLLTVISAIQLASFQFVASFSI